MWLQGIVTLGHRNESLRWFVPGEMKLEIKSASLETKTWPLEETGYSSGAVGTGMSRKKR